MTCVLKTLQHSPARANALNSMRLQQPPRKGCDEGFLGQLVAVAPQTLVYVSCNVHTQARDVGFLLRQDVGGKRYVLESVRPLHLLSTAPSAEPDLLAYLCALAPRLRSLPADGPRRRRRRPPTPVSIVGSDARLHLIMNFVQAVNRSVRSSLVHPRLHALFHPPKNDSKRFASLARRSWWRLKQSSWPWARHSACVDIAGGWASPVRCSLAIYCRTPGLVEVSLQAAFYLLASQMKRSEDVALDLLSVWLRDVVDRVDRCRAAV